MKFIIITGPQAVGKMTVGMALAEKTGLKVFHNHMTIEPVVKVFDYHSPQAKRLINAFRKQFFEEMANSDLPGMIFTYVCAFNLEHDTKYMMELLDYFKAHGAETFLVELESDMETRLKRNVTPLRLEEKPTKRNLEWSNEDIVKSVDKYRLNSLPGEIEIQNYLRIDNSKLEPEEVADIIIGHFDSLNV